MIHRDYLIIGAGVGSAAACEAIRQYDKKGTITLIGAEGHPPYARPSLYNKFLYERNPNPANLYHFDAAWYAKHKVELRLDTIVKYFNVEHRLAVLAPGQTIEFKKAILAMGSRPKRPVIGGANLGNIFHLRSIRDAVALREVLDTEQSILIVGGGLVAVQSAAALVKAGKQVTLMCRDEYLWQKRVDTETAQWLTELFEHNGVKLMMQETLNGFEGKTIVRNVQTKSGVRFPAASVLMAVGTELNLELIQNTPLSSPNGTPVNEHLETDEKGVYAIGDIALYPDRLFGGVRRNEQYENSLIQGAVAGANITGKKRQRFEYIPHFSAQVFDYQFDFVGDFSSTPYGIELDGSYEKGKFTAKYYQGDRLVGVLLCNQARKNVEEARALFGTAKR